MTKRQVRLTTGGKLEEVNQSCRIFTCESIHPPTRKNGCVVSSSYEVIPPSRSLSFDYRPARARPRMDQKGDQLPFQSSSDNIIIATLLHNSGSNIPNLIIFYLGYILYSE